MSDKAKSAFKSRLDVMVTRYSDNVADLEYSFGLLKKGGYAFGVLRKPDGRFFVARKSEPDDKEFPEIVIKDDHSKEDLVYYYRKKSRTMSAH